jgi:hypothetical protein
MTAEITAATEASVERRNIEELEAKISNLEDLLLAAVAKVKKKPPNSYFRIYYKNVKLSSPKLT